MTTRVCYESIKAKSREEAIEKCKFKVGQLLRISALDATGTTDGQWTIIPRLETVDEKESN